MLPTTFALAFSLALALACAGEADPDPGQAPQPPAAQGTPAAEPAESAPDRGVVQIENRPPVIDSLILDPAREITVQDTLSASARASDPDGDEVELRYTWLVNGTPVAERGSSLTAPHFARGDQIRLEVVASDGEDETDPVLSPEIAVLNSPPRIVSDPMGFDAAGAFRYAVQVEDADHDRRLRFRLVEGPSGMRIDWLKGTVLWEPEENQEGSHRVVIEVDDLAGGTTTQTFELEVVFTTRAKTRPRTPTTPRTR